MKLNQIIRTPGVTETMVQLYKQGWTFDKIGQRFGLKRTSARGYLKPILLARGMKIRSRPDYAVPAKAKICPVCKQTFVRRKRLKQVYCSFDCAQKENWLNTSHFPFTREAVEEFKQLYYGGKSYKELGHHLGYTKSGLQYLIKRLIEMGEIELNHPHLSHKRTTK